MPLPSSNRAILSCGWPGVIWMRQTAGRGRPAGAAAACLFSHGAGGSPTAAAALPGRCRQRRRFPNDLLPWLRRRGSTHLRRLWRPPGAGHARPTPRRANPASPDLCAAVDPQNVRTNRTAQQVMGAATWGVFGRGWRDDTWRRRRPSQDAGRRHRHGGGQLPFTTGPASVWMTVRTRRPIAS